MSNSRLPVLIKVSLLILLILTGLECLEDLSGRFPQPESVRPDGHECVTHLDVGLHSGDIHAKNACAKPGLPACSVHIRHSGLDSGFQDISQLPQTPRQVVGSDEYDLQTLYLSDGINIFDSQLVFDLGDD